jgi:hypothetical protein
MSDQDIFDNSNSNSEATPPVRSDDPFSDKLKQIKNEQGEQKYKDIDTALEALKASQEYIKELKAKTDATAQEKEALRAELDKMGSIDDFVKRISPTATPEVKDEATPPVNTGLSEEKVAQLIQQQLQSEKQVSQQEKNLDSVVKELSGVYGDKVAEHIKQRAEELSTTPAELKELAKRNPKLALVALKGDAKPNSTPSRSSQSSPLAINEGNEKPVFEKGVTQGGFTNQELADRWREVGKYTHKRLGVETSG